MLHMTPEKAITVKLALSKRSTNESVVAVR